MMTPRNTRSRSGKTSPRQAATAALAGVLVALAVLLLAPTGGSTHALFSANTVAQGGTVQAGDLQVSLGEATWRQVTPGVAEGASGLLASAPDGFVSMPGDVIEIRVPATTFLQGDNAAGAMTVDFLVPSPAQDDIAATFHVENEAGIQVAPASSGAPIGTSLVIPGLVGDNAGVSAEWTIVLRIAVLGDYRWVTPASPDPGASWSAGAVRVTLDQVRAFSSDPGGA